MTEIVRHVDLPTARAASKVLKEMIGKHRKLCRDCVDLTPRANRYCPEWWQLAKEHAAAVADVRRLELERQGDNLTLF